MVWIREWEAFLEEARAIYASSYEKARCTIKSKGDSSETILKVTDDQRCVKHSCYNDAELWKTEALLQLYITWASSEREKDINEYPVVCKAMQNVKTGHKLRKSTLM